MTTAGVTWGASAAVDASVLIIDHREVIRRGVASMVGSFARPVCCHCVAAFEDVESSYDIAIAPVAAYPKPEHSRYSVPARRSIALIESSHPDDLEAAARARTDGYLLLAELTANSLHTAVDQVLDDQTFLPKVLADHLLERSCRPDVAISAGSVRLSPREAEVLDLVCAGLSNKQIATRLDVSIHGAKRHVSSLLGKFSAPSRSYLIAQVLQTSTR